MALLATPLDHAHATLTGDFIFGELLLKDDPNAGNLFDASATPGCAGCTVPPFPTASTVQPFAVVQDPDVFFPEFSFRKTGEYDLTADVDSASVEVVLDNITTGFLEGWEIRLRDLSWNDGVPGILTSATIVDPNSIPGLTVDVIDSGTGLLIDFPGAGVSPPLAIPTGGPLSATIVFTTEAVIPEPATAASVAMAAVTLLTRRRR